MASDVKKRGKHYVRSAGDKTSLLRLQAVKSGYAMKTLVAFCGSGAGDRFNGLGRRRLLQALASQPGM